VLITRIVYEALTPIHGRTRDYWLEDERMDYGLKFANRKVNIKDNRRIPDLLRKNNEIVSG
jgi:hypothetical protein